MTPFVCRSALFMPANNERAMLKGTQLDCDAVIVDLEDSVAPSEKSNARDKAVAALSQQDYGSRIRAIRINATDSPWCEEDLQALTSCNVDKVVVPKLDSADMLMSLSDRMDALGVPPEVGIWSMVESPKAVLAIEQIAALAATTRLQAILIGSNDLARTAGMPITNDRRYLIPWFMAVIAAAKTHSLAVLDSVYNNFKDSSGFAIECSEARDMGMTGKTLIHPAQIAIANDVWSPGTDEISAAQKIVDCFSRPENAKAGVVQLDGQMVERLHLGIAQQTLAVADRIAQIGNGRP